VDLPIPAAPNHERHVLQELVLDVIWEYLNPQMLYGKHMGLKGNARNLLEAGDAKALELKAVFDEIKQECRNGGMKAQAVWQFCPATSEGNRLILHGVNGAAPETIDFPRQPKAEGVALPDFVLSPDGGRKDTVAIFLTTAGLGIREQAEKLKNSGEYVRSHALQALALETAEAAAEWMHAQIRGMWGFGDPPEMTHTQRFQAKYRGKRYSPGYPACPRLEDQEQLFRLLEPERIGVNLTDGFMMEPEASVSALVFHHPDAAYFSVGALAEDEAE
jgi:5-methyltetrahydrofolate--homocysteine methyltransferase